MKKFISALLTLALVLSMVVPTTAMAASDSGQILANDWERVYAENVKDGYMTNHTLYENSGYYGLKPAGDGVANIEFLVDVKTAGLYTLTVIGTAGSGTAYDRKCDLVVNDAFVQQLTFMEFGWTTPVEIEVYISLQAGENVVAFTTPSDYDDVTVKTPNLYAIKYELKRAMAVEPTTAPEPTKAPDPTATPVPTEAPKPTE